MLNPCQQEVDKLSHLEWKARYVPGALEARGLRGGKLVKTDRVETTGKPAKIVLAADRTKIAANGQGYVPRQEAGALWTLVRNWCQDHAERGIVRNTRSHRKFVHLCSLLTHEIEQATLPALYRKCR